MSEDNKWDNIFTLDPDDRDNIITLETRDGLLDVVLAELSEEWRLEGAIFEAFKGGEYDYYGALTRRVPWGLYRDKQPEVKKDSADRARVHLVTWRCIQGACEALAERYPELAIELSWAEYGDTYDWRHGAV